jgi:hypothetical protein
VLITRGSLVRAQPDPPDVAVSGGLAQLGEHLLCKQGVVGSIPSTSTKNPYRSGVAPRRRRHDAIAVWFFKTIGCFAFFNNLEEVVKTCPLESGCREGALAKADGL